VLQVPIDAVGAKQGLHRETIRLARPGRPHCCLSVQFETWRVGRLAHVAKQSGIAAAGTGIGHDPAAVAFDGIRASRARGYDLLFIDTAGRLHTKFNLMRELEKTYNVCRKSVHAAPHDVLLVLDAPTGQNALAQAAKFKESAHASGFLFTKLDSTATGGMVLAIGRELNLPVRFIGTGEGIEDLAPFDPDAYIEGLFAN